MISVSSRRLAVLTLAPTLTSRTLFWSRYKREKDAYDAKKKAAEQPAQDSDSNDSNSASDDDDEEESS